MELNNKKVLVTGAGGFIGSHLVETLAPMCGELTAMIKYNSRNHWGDLESLPSDVLKGVEVLAGDVQDPFFMDRIVKHKEVVFHLAALIPIPYSYLAPQSYVRTNVEGTLNVMMACRAHGVSKVVHTSTSEAYGSALYTPIDEKHPLQAQSPYAASKIAADKIAESFHLSFDLPVATIRPFNTYGPRQSARAVIPTIISQALTRDRVQLGSLTPVRDLTFVKDTAQAFVEVARAEGSSGHVLNAGNGKGISIGELAQLILELMDSDKSIEADPQRVRPDKSEVVELICDSAALAEISGWTPQHDLKEGLRQTIAYVERDLARYKTELYNV